jgi:hypothetical protein
LVDLDFCLHIFVYDEKVEEAEENVKVIAAWDKAFLCSFNEIVEYNNYISENFRFGTHQGVKGLEFVVYLLSLMMKKQEGHG